MKETVTKVPDNLFRLLWGKLFAQGAVELEDDGKKCNGLRLNDGLEYYIIVPESNEVT